MYVMYVCKPNSGKLRAGSLSIPALDFQQLNICSWKRGRESRFGRYAVVYPRDPQKRTLWI